MACISSKIIYETCGHVEYQVVACRCGKGWKFCNIEEGRVILSASLASACRQDLDDSHQHSKAAYKRYCQARAARYLKVEDEDKSTDASNDDKDGSLFAEACARALRRFYEKVKRGEVRGHWRNVHSIKTAIKWITNTSRQLADCMFQPGYMIPRGEKALRTCWVRIPPGLTVQSFALLSEEKLVELQCTLKGKGRYQREAVLRNWQFSRLPAVPPFPRAKLSYAERGPV